MYVDIGVPERGFGDRALDRNVEFRCKDLQLIMEPEGILWYSVKTGGLGRGGTLR